MTATLTAQQLFEAQAHPLKLKWLAGKRGGARELEAPTAKFPGMALVGYLNLIHPNRVQVIAQTEISYLDQLDREGRKAALELVFGRPQTAVFVVCGGDAASDLRDQADAAGVALFLTPLDGPIIVEGLNYYLSHALAPTTVVHGVFMEVMGIGVLITGESGIGKSELALELLSRNHRMIADDAVEMVRSGPETLIGRCLNNQLTEYLEVRGLGIINVRTMFGETAVRHRKQLHFIIRLERLAKEDMHKIDRFQAEQSTRTLLDIEMPETVLYVAPGRNLAVLVEAATRTQILRMWGMNPSEEFLQRHAALLDPRTP